MAWGFYLRILLYLILLLVLFAVIVFPYLWNEKVRKSFYEGLWRFNFTVRFIGLLFRQRCSPFPTRRREKQGKGKLFLPPGPVISSHREWREGGISDISSVALYHRAQKSAEWLRWMCEGMLEQLGTSVTKPEWLEGHRVRAIDGSHISEQRSTGSDWILHYSWDIFGLRNDYFEITPSSQGEKTVRFPIQKGDIILADRLYGKAKGFDYIVGAGGDFVMRLKRKAAKYYDKDGHRVELLPLLREKFWTSHFTTTPSPERLRPQNHCAFTQYEKVLSRRNARNERHAAK